MSIPIRRVFAATDFSAAAGAALDRAVRLARLHDAELVLVHALDRSGWIGAVGGSGLDAGRIRDACERALESERTRLAAVYAGPIRTALLDLALHRALPDLLIELPAELLVMGASGASQWPRALLGSTADRVLRAQLLPVLTVRGAVEADHRRVALATDFSAAALHAARFGLALAPRADALLLHAHQPEFASTLAFAGVSAALQEDYRRQATQTAIRDLEAFADRLGEAGRQAIPALREGHPARVLAAFVEEASVDLLVLGAQSKSGIERGLLGSVSSHAANSLPIDVLVVPFDAAATDA